jgi:hypothetical protein
MQVDSLFIVTATLGHEQVKRVARQLVDVHWCGRCALPAAVRCRLGASDLPGNANAVRRVRPLKLNLLILNAVLFER